MLHTRREGLRWEEAAKTTGKARLVKDSYAMVRVDVHGCPCCPLDPMGHCCGGAFTLTNVSHHGQGHEALFKQRSRVFYNGNVNVLGQRCAWFQWSLYNYVCESGCNSMLQPILGGTVKPGVSQ